MRTALLPLLLLPTLALAARPAKKPVAPEPPPLPIQADMGVPRDRPGPLEPSPFKMPEMQRATLSNGLEVVVVRNDEVPLWNLSLVFKVGPDADPKGKEELGDVTFDMMNEGAAGMDAAALSKALKRLGGSVGSGAGRDSAAVSVSGPVQSLEGLLDLWAAVLLQPEFPESAWQINRSRRIGDLLASFEDPGAIAGRSSRTLLYGDTYVGRLPTQAAYEAITTKDMKKFHKAMLRPDRAILLAGGDLTLDTLVPLLEKRLAKWKAKGKPPTTAFAGVVRPFETEQVFLIDKPGAAQSVLRAALPVNDRGAADYYPLLLANTAFGGAFTARVNMNLREDKGWTYGARCGIDDNPGTSIWNCSANIQTDKTVPALMELRREVSEVVGDNPIRLKELAFFKGYRINSFQTAYETPNSLLGELQDIWTYDLPTDWLDQYVANVQGVTTEAANEAMRTWIQPSRVSYLIVGDKAVIGEELAATGLPVIELDRDGHPLAR